MELELDKLRQVGDPIADNFVSIYFGNYQKKEIVQTALNQLNLNSDWPNFLQAIPEAIWFDTEMINIITPSKKILYNAVVFYKAKEPYILQLLGLLSLPYCYAAADGAKVLYNTERMYKDVAKRLEETAIFIKKVMCSNAFESNGAGLVEIFKVRLIHAAGRFYLLKTNWDLTLGVPINQEDMAGTNLSFSLIIIRGLRKMGFAISEIQQTAYLEYWNYIGQILGLNPKLLPKNGKDAYLLELLISKRQFKKSNEGQILTQSLLKCFYSLNTQDEIKNEEIPKFMRYLLGNQVADILDLPKGEFSAFKQTMLKFKVLFG